MALILTTGLCSGLLAGWLGRGRLSAIGRATLRWSWLIPLAVALQLPLLLSRGSGVSWWVPLLHVASYATLLLVVLANRRVWGLPLLGLGLLMNTVVIGANGGLMPQAPETARLRHAASDLVIGSHLRGTKDVLLTRDGTRLWWLSDYVLLPTTSDRPAVVSPGDLVLGAGLGATVFGLMRAGRRANTPAGAPVPALRTDSSRGEPR